MSEEWFRKSTWTEFDEEDFFSRLKRSRQYNRSQYLRIQAWHLTESGMPELLKVAISLLDILIRDYPERGQLASAFLQKAEAFSALGYSDEALLFFKKAIEFEREFPNVCTAAPLEFGLFVVRNHLSDQYSYALSILEEFEESNSTFPVQRFEVSAVRSLIAAGLGDKDIARMFAQQVLVEASAKHSGFWKHPRIGLVGKTEETLLEQLEKLL